MLLPSRTLDFVWCCQWLSGFEYLRVPNTLCAWGPHIQVAFPLWAFNLSKDWVSVIVLSRFRVIRTLWRVAVSTWTQVACFQQRQIPQLFLKCDDQVQAHEDPAGLPGPLRQVFSDLPPGSFWGLPVASGQQPLSCSKGHFLLEEWSALSHVRHEF